MGNSADILLSLATQRKTVRKFTPDMPSNKDIERVLETVCQAPSGSNEQPWRFLIIDKPAVKARIRQAAEDGEKIFYENIGEENRRKYKAMGHSWRKPMLEKAPLLIVVLADTTSPNFRPSVWLSIGYMVLALEAAGISSVTYTPSDGKRVESVLDIPDRFQLESILPVGYSDDPKIKGLRKAFTEVTYMNRWPHTNHLTPHKGV